MHLQILVRDASFANRGIYKSTVPHNASQIAKVLDRKAFTSNSRALYSHLSRHLLELAKIYERQTRYPCSGPAEIYSCGIRQSWERRPKSLELHYDVNLRLQNDSNFSFRLTFLSFFLSLFLSVPESGVTYYRRNNAPGRVRSERGKWAPAALLYATAMSKVISQQIVRSHAGM